MLGLSLWAVYDHPTDFPDHYVAREHLVDGTGSRATPHVIRSADLEHLRGVLQFQLGLVRLDRSPEDDPKIVETWL